MKQVIAFVLVLLALLFAGCSGNAAPPLTPAPTINPTLFLDATSVTAVPTTPVATSPSTSPQQVTGVTTDVLNIRAGPGLNYAVKGQLKQGDRITIIGKSADGIWWQFNGGWVSGTYIQVDGDPTAVPVATPVSLN